MLVGVGGGRPGPRAGLAGRRRLVGAHPDGAELAELRTRAARAAASRSLARAACRRRAGGGRAPGGRAGEAAPAGRGAAPRAARAGRCRRQGGRRAPARPATLVTRGWTRWTATSRGSCRSWCWPASCRSRCSSQIALVDWVSAVLIAVTLPLDARCSWSWSGCTPGRAPRGSGAASRCWRATSSTWCGPADPQGLRPGQGAGRHDPPGRRRRTGRRPMRVLRVAFLSSFVLELVATLSVASSPSASGCGCSTARWTCAPRWSCSSSRPEAYLPMRDVGAAFHASAEGLAAADEAFDLLRRHRPTARGARAAGARPARRSSVVLDAVVGVRPDTGGPAAARPARAGPRGPATTMAVIGAQRRRQVHAARRCCSGCRTPDAGRVLVGGTDLADLDPAAWRGARRLAAAAPAAVRRARWPTTSASASRTPTTRRCAPRSRAAGASLVATCRSARRHRARRAGRRAVGRGAAAGGGRPAAAAHPPARLRAGAARRADRAPRRRHRGSGWLPRSPRAAPAGRRCSRRTGPRRRRPTDVVRRRCCGRPAAAGGRVSATGRSPDRVLRPARAARWRRLGARVRLAGCRRRRPASVATARRRRLADRARRRSSPPIVALSVAVVAVRAFAVGAGVRPLRSSGWSPTTRRCGCWPTCGSAVYRRLERLAPSGLPAFRSGDLLTRLVARRRRRPGRRAARACCRGRPALVVGSARRGGRRLPAAAGRRGAARRPGAGRGRGALADRAAVAPGHRAAPSRRAAGWRPTSSTPPAGCPSCSPTTPWTGGWTGWPARDRELVGHLDRSARAEGLGAGALTLVVGLAVLGRRWSSAAGQPAARPVRGRDPRRGGPAAARAGRGARRRCPPRAASWPGA